MTTTSTRIRGNEYNDVVGSGSGGDEDKPGKEVKRTEENLDGAGTKKRRKNVEGRK